MKTTNEIKLRTWDIVNKTMVDVIDFSCMNYPDRYKVMQFTRWTDRNEKKVYEGDILMQWINDILQEDFYIVTDMCKLYHEANIEDKNKKITEIEVIGNIYEDLGLYCHHRMKEERKKQND